MPQFKDIVYFPSFSAAAGYYIKNIPVCENVNFRFYEDGNVDPEFMHKYFLISGGIHYKKENIREQMGLEKGKTFVMGDSGGYQIAVGTLPWSLNLREKIFHWLENNSDIAVNLDIPPRAEKSGVFQESLDISYDNFKWFNENQSGKTKFLSVIHGVEPEQYPIWYNKVKGFDFHGWCIGGGQGNMSRMMFAFATLLQNGEFENKNNQYLHFLGQTKPQDFFLLNVIQKKLDQNGMGHVQVMTDSSTPWQYSIFGNIIYYINYQTLAYMNTWPQKHLNYNDDDKYPCPIDCPVCRNITMKDVRPYNTQTNHMMAYHNFFMFKKLMKDIKGLCSSNLDLLSEFLPKNIQKVLISIEQMVDNPKKALSIAAKYKPLYDKFSYTEKVKTEKNLSDEFFH